MNPDDQADLEAIFGESALRNLSRTAPDRVAEGWVRKRRGTALPDMRRGSKPTASKYPAVPLNPLDDGGDEGPPRGRETLEIDRPHSTRPTSRNRPRDIAEPMMVETTVKGRKRRAQATMTLDEYRTRRAQPDEKLEAARRAFKVAVADAPVLSLPISQAPPPRFADIDAAVREYARQTLRRQRPRPEAIGWIPQQEPELVVAERTLPGSLAEDDDDRILGPDDDRAQWEIDHAEEIAEDLARERQERDEALECLDREMARETELDQLADPLCVHCKVDPIQTKKDQLCRNCKTYRKTHQGILPPRKVIESRRRKRQ